MKIVWYQIRELFLQRETLNLVWRNLFDQESKKNTVPWTYVISTLKGEEIVGTFHENRVAENQSKRIQDLKNNQDKQW